MSRGYFVDEDDYGDLWLWRRTSDPDFPIPILNKTEANREAWLLALSGAGVEDPS